MVEKTKEEVEKEFLTDFQALLEKYNAHIAIHLADETRPLRMVADIPGVYNEEDADHTIAEWTQINIGSYIDANNPNGRYWGLGNDGEVVK